MDLVLSRGPRIQPWTQCFHGARTKPRTPYLAMDPVDPVRGCEIIPQPRENRWAGLGWLGWLAGYLAVLIYIGWGCWVEIGGGRQAGRQAGWS